jgi:hypothetical protein
MKDTVNIFNHFHNGDVFYSRILINILKKKFKKIKYYHTNPTPILCDIDDLEEFNFIPDNYPVGDNIFEENIVNSWVGHRGNVYSDVSTKGTCNFENYYKLCEFPIDYYGIEKLKYEDLLPQINYDKIPNIENIKIEVSRLMSKYQKGVLICNGGVNSGQSGNFDFTNIVNKLSQEFPNTLFFTTNPISTISENVKFCSDLTQTTPDLLQISYISTQCDFIIGRASGPYCFSQVRENLMNPKKTFIAFSIFLEEAKYFDEQMAKFVWSNDWSSEENIVNVIKQNIL